MDQVLIADRGLMEKKLMQPINSLSGASELPGEWKGGPPYEATAQENDEPGRNSLSHELRTSLAIITLLCGNLDRLYERLNEKDRRAIIRNLRKHTHKLNALVGDVLERWQEQDHEI